MEWDANEKSAFKMPICIVFGKREKPLLVPEKLNTIP